MSRQHFDLIVLGTGPAGSTVARKVAKDGHKVAIVESRQYGGTCALRGCNPKKVYTNAAAIVDQVQRANGSLISVSNICIDWPQLLAFKAEFTEPVARKSEASFRDDGIATFQGAAVFSGPNTIEVGSDTLTADRVLIATGARPATLSIPGEEHVTHSDDFLELDSIADRVVFIGGGYISLEFAHVVARYGARATIVHNDTRVLKGFDPDLVDTLMKSSAECGIQFLLGGDVVSVEKSAKHTFQVKTSKGDTVDGDLVVHGAGRTPNIQDLQLEVADVCYNEQGVQVNEFMQTTNHSIYAAGDCAASGVPQLTPAANEEARIVATNLISDEQTARPDYGAIPKVVFTTPALASVGLQQKEAEDEGFDVDVRSDDTSSWGSVRKLGRSVAGYKILVDKQTDAIVGAHLLGPAAEETINIFALAMKVNLTATDIKSTLFAFPTFAADTRQMV